MGIKRRTVSVLIIILLNILINCHVSAGIQSDDYFIYEVTNAEYYIEIGENKRINNGYLFGSDLHAAGVEINATIYSISSNGINFRFWLEDQCSNSFFSIDWLDYKGLKFSYYTLYYTYEMIENFGNGYMVDLTLYTIYPYIDPKYNDYLTDSGIFEKDLNSQFDTRLTVNRDIKCSFIYEESDDGIVYFESWVGGKIDSIFGYSINGEKSYDTDIEFGNNFHYVADKDSGIVYGLGRQGWVKGTINNTEVKVSMSCEYQLKNYKIANYQFGNYRDFIIISKLNKILVPSIIFAVLIISPIIFMITKKRISKNNSEKNQKEFSEKIR